MTILQHFGPYKSGNGQWLTANCSIGYQNVMNNCSHNNTCSTISDFHKRKACNVGFDLGKYKQLTKELKAIKKQGYIELVGNECVIPSKGRKIDIKIAKKDLIFTRDYTLEFEINPGPIADEQVNGKDWRNIFSRVYDESQVGHHLEVLEYQLYSFGRKIIRVKQVMNYI